MAKELHSKWQELLSISPEVTIDNTAETCDFYEYFNYFRDDRMLPAKEESVKRSRTHSLKASIKEFISPHNRWNEPKKLLHPSDERGKEKHSSLGEIKRSIYEKDYNQSEMSEWHPSLSVENPNQPQGEVQQPNGLFSRYSALRRRGSVSSVTISRGSSQVNLNSLYSSNSPYRRSWHDMVDETALNEEDQMLTLINESRIHSASVKAVNSVKSVDHSIGRSRNNLRTRRLYLSTMKPAYSTPSLFDENAEFTDTKVRQINGQLSQFRDDNLPKIPTSFLSSFPQDLHVKWPKNFDLFNSLRSPGEQLSPSNRFGDPEMPELQQCQRNISTSSSMQHYEAILELVQTEARYVKVLKMILDVHVALFLELTQSDMDADSDLSASVPRLLSQIGQVEDSSQRKKVDNLFERARHSRQRRHMRSIIEAPQLISARGSGIVEKRPSSSLLNESMSLSNLSMVGDVFADPLPTAPTVYDIFGNLGQVYGSSVKFWNECFFPAFPEHGDPIEGFNVRHMKHAFTRFDAYFETYINYLSSCNILTNNIQQLERSNRAFACYCEWTTRHNYLQMRENLTSLLRQPFQRILRYSMLLERIRQETEDSQELNDLDDMIRAVDQFMKKVNSILPDQAAQANLDHFLKRVDVSSYLDEVKQLCRDVASKDIREQLRRPMMSNTGSRDHRCMIAEVPAKVRSLSGKIGDVTCVLMTDVMLLCKQKSRKENLCVCRPPISLLDLEVRKQEAGCWSTIWMGTLGIPNDVYVFTGNEKHLLLWFSKLEAAKAALIKKESNIPITPSVCLAHSEIQTFTPSIKASNGIRPASMCKSAAQTKIDSLQMRTVLENSNVEEPYRQMSAVVPRPKNLDPTFVLSSTKLRHSQASPAESQRTLFTRRPYLDNSLTARSNNSDESRSTISGNDSDQSACSTLFHEGDVKLLQRTDYPMNLPETKVSPTRMTSTKV